MKTQKLAYIKASLVVVFNEKDEILLLKRFKNDDFAPDTFCFPGGKCDGNETHKEGAIRETKEEAGIFLREHNLTELNYFDFFKNDIEYNIQVYKTKLKRTPKVSLSWEHEDYTWLPASKAIKMPLSGFITKDTIKNFLSHQDEGAKFIAIPTYLENKTKISSQTREVIILEKIKPGIVKFKELEPGIYDKNIRRRLWEKGDIRFVEERLWKFKEI